MKNGNGSEIDIAAVKAALCARAAEFAKELYPKGKLEAGNWVIGDITGAPGKSFKICLTGDKAGLCKDFAGDKACSLIDAYMGARGVQFHAALEACAQWAGIRRGDHHEAKDEFDWDSCRDALTGEQLAKFAAWRGYSIEHCERLKDRGLLGSFEGVIALPVYDPHGACAGVQYFPNGSRSLYRKGTPSFPLIIGQPKSPAAKRVFVFESPWDAFAYIERCKLGDCEAVISTRGAANGSKVAGRIHDGAEVIAFRQNDLADERGHIADEDWFALLRKAMGRKIRSVRIGDHKDLNDWTRAGATGDQISSLVRSSPFYSANGDLIAALVSKRLSELSRPEDKSDELLQYRFLCRGAGALLVGPSGIGKSSLAMQAMILWAIGFQCFGIRPAMPLKSLLIQAENDEGDLAEMRDGVIAGIGLTKEQSSNACQRVIEHTCNHVSGAAFIAEIVEPLLEEHHPELLWLDPALAYIGGNASSQEDVGGFLRGMLNPLLKRHNCAAVIIHHTNKPPTGKEKSEWAGGDFAYLGSGSAEWANWSRAVIALRSVGKHDVFELRLGKRGSRVGWIEDDGLTKSYAKPIAHSKEPGAICWRDAEPEEISSLGAPKRFTPAMVLETLGKEEFTTAEWMQAAMDEIGVGKSKFHELRNLRAVGFSKRTRREHIFSYMSYPHRSHLQPSPHLSQVSPSPRHDLSLRHTLTPHRLHLTTPSTSPSSCRR